MIEGLISSAQQVKKVPRTIWDRIHPRFSMSSCPASLLSIALNLLGLVLIVPFVGCNNGAEVPPTPAPLQTYVVPPVLMIKDPTGDRRNAKDIAEIQEVVPFDVVIPRAEDLPGDFYITGISVHPEPASVSEGREEGEERWVQVLLFLRSDELKAGFTIFEGTAAPIFDSPIAKSFDREDISLKVIFFDEKKRIAARWEACDIEFFMEGGYLDQFADDNLLHIVDATVKACE